MASLLGGNIPQKEMQKGFCEVHPELSTAWGPPWGFIDAPGNEVEWDLL